MVKKNVAHFCENRKNHGSFAKTHGFQLQKNIYSR